MVNHPCRDVPHQSLHLFPKGHTSNMKSMSTPVVFFDIGATLIAGPALTPAQQIAAALGFDDTARHRFDQRLLTSRLETPAALAALLTSACSVPEKMATDLATAVWQSQTEAPEVIQGGVELLSALRAAGVQYGFISNIWFPYAATFLQLYGPLAESRLTFFSFRLGVAKPDPDVFRQAVAAAGGMPQACVMVGDSYDSDMRPAIALGMRTVWILHRPEQEQTELKRIRRKKLSAPDKVVPFLAGLNVSMLTDWTSS